MKKNIFAILISSTVLLSNELPKFNVQTTSTTNQKTEISNQLTSGLSYLDVCDITNLDSYSFNEPSKIIENISKINKKCVEEYSRADLDHTFKIDDYKPTNWLNNDKNDIKYIKFRTKLLVPQEYLRDGSINLISNGFNGLKELSENQYKYSFYISTEIDGQKLSGDTYLISNKSEIELTIHILANFISTSGAFKAKSFNENLEEIHKLINNNIEMNLSFQEIKRGEKKTIKISTNNIGMNK